MAAEEQQGQNKKKKDDVWSAVKRAFREGSYFSLAAGLVSAVVAVPGGQFLAFAGGLTATTGMAYATWKIGAWATKTSLSILGFSIEDKKEKKKLGQVILDIGKDLAMVAGIGVTVMSFASLFGFGAVAASPQMMAIADTAVTTASNFSQNMGALWRLPAQIANAPVIGTILDPMARSMQMFGANIARIGAACLGAAVLPSAARASSTVVPKAVKGAANLFSRALRFRSNQRQAGPGGNQGTNQGHFAPQAGQTPHVVRQNPNFRPNPRFAGLPGLVSADSVSPADRHDYVLDMNDPNRPLTAAEKAQIDAYKAKTAASRARTNNLRGVEREFKETVVPQVEKTLQTASTAVPELKRRLDQAAPQNNRSAG